LQEISRRRTGLVPVDAPTASILHFSLVLDALVSLAEVRTRASQPTS
jgi:hypothetical protein